MGIAILSTSREQDRGGNQLRDGNYRVNAQATPTMLNVQATITGLLKLMAKASIEFSQPTIGWFVYIIETSKEQGSRQVEEVEIGLQNWLDDCNRPKEEPMPIKTTEVSW
ncbi:hypothetical protein GUJ93_ZPchr0005g15163 [Zizania palustris]|uniref:Uncharacterized protein n=1 Tax=Zizania palustris TaxID=103762 RepID=A0A8J5S3A6_ZIZPA|nr:hypothetical protein GUJ93_ZPchr0005g15163 [Zizania palustris]